MINRDLIIQNVLLESIKQLYREDYDFIRHDVSERCVCAKLAHYMQMGIQGKGNEFDSVKVDVEYKRTGDGDEKKYINTEKRIITSDLLIHKRGGENYLAAEMKKTRSRSKATPDRERLKLMVSPWTVPDGTNCVRNTLVGAMIIYDVEKVTVEIYEYMKNVQKSRGTVSYIMEFNANGEVLRVQEAW